MLSFSFGDPAGFEPRTHSLEGCCSIQLSYETNTFFQMRVQRYYIFLKCANFSFANLK